MALSIDRVVELATSWMDSIDGVVGVAQGQTTDGRDAIVVYISGQFAAGELPATLEGFPVIIHESEPFQTQ